MPVTAGVHLPAERRTDAARIAGDPGDGSMGLRQPPHSSVPDQLGDAGHFSRLNVIGQRV